MSLRQFYTLIDNDCFGIARRLKSIDESYFVVYNSKLKRYEVHSHANKGKNTLCVVVPYPCLDCRTVLLVNMTRAERM